MNYLLFNPKAKNAKTAEDLAMIHKALQSQQIREYNLTDYEDYKDMKSVEVCDQVYRRVCKAVKLGERNMPEQAVRC